MRETIPEITEADIQRLGSERSFQRGQSYYRSGALFEPVRQGNELRGYCEGSSYEPYRVSARLGAQGIEHTSCTCPYDWGGLCKHRIALLLTWVHEPDSFHIVSPPDEILANRSKEALIALIKEMLKREPDLVRLLELPVQPNRHTPLELEAFRRQISYALRHDYPEADQVATELIAIVETADRFQAGGDWSNAGALYTLILNEVVPQYEQLYDDDGDVALVLQSCAEGLERCLTEGPPEVETRQVWLEAMLDAELKDIELGGIGLAHPAGEVIINHATDEEWSWIEARLKQALAAQVGHYSNWAREALLRFLIRRLEVTGQETEAADLIFESGTPEQQAFLLVKQERFDEAVTMANEYFSDLPGLVTRFADTLVVAGAGEQAEVYVAGLLENRFRSTYLTWLAQHAEQEGRLTTALDWWRQSMDQTPTAQTYNILRQIATQLEMWPQVRRELLAKLEDKKDWSTLIEIALDEKEAGRALELLTKLRGWSGHTYELRVAQVSEGDHPQAALEIYRRRVKGLIKARGRGNYQEAARLLQRVRGIYQRQQAQATWEKYIATLRQGHRNLPAFQDELNKAGL
jgi:tetratricopeptide (TPR) repeat protein